MSQCAAVRVGNNPKKQPGKQRVYRCRNTAIRAIRVHQTDQHARVAGGWFEVELCDSCFFRSSANAIVKLKGEGRHEWRYL